MENKIQEKVSDPGLYWFCQRDFFSLARPLLRLQWRPVFHGGLDILAGTGII